MRIVAVSLNSGCSKKETTSNINHLTGTDQEMDIKCQNQGKNSILTLLIHLEVVTTVAVN